MKGQGKAAGMWVARVVALSALCLAGCSKVLDWDASGLPCDTSVRDGYTYFCQAGYSCETTGVACLRDKSVRTGGSCTLSRQCVSGDACPVDILSGGGVRGQDHVLSCLPSCSAVSSAVEPYLASDGCLSSSQVCLPFLDQLASNANKGLIGACVGSSPCKEGAGCAINSNTNGVCVQITPSATACLPSCEISWNGTTYADNCGDGLHSCQPIGLMGHQQFSCVYNGQSSTATPLASVQNISVQAQGAACAPVSHPCQDGNVCVPQKNVCAQYCQLTANATSSCPTNQTCCPFTSFASAPTATGFCATSCN